MVELWKLLDGLSMPWLNVFDMRATLRAILPQNRNEHLGGHSVHSGRWAEKVADRDEFYTCDGHLSWYSHPARTAALPCFSPMRSVSCSSSEIRSPLSITCRETPAFNVWNALESSRELPNCVQQYYSAARSIHGCTYMYKRGAVVMSGRVRFS